MLFHLVADPLNVINLTLEPIGSDGEMKSGVHHAAAAVRSECSTRRCEVEDEGRAAKMIPSRDTVTA